jgi:hypothetical protein
MEFVEASARQILYNRGLHKSEFDFRQKTFGSNSIIRSNQETRQHCFGAF